MTTYAWEQIEHEAGYDEEFEVDGEIVPGTVQHDDPNSTRFIALVRKPDQLEEDSASSQSTDEERPHYVCGEDTTNGRCSREVDSPDETCWQH